MSSPYITPAMLTSAPTGISWDTIPDFDSTPDAQFAEQVNMCWRATHFIDAYCGQVLRATTDTEEFMAPDYRMVANYHGTGLARCIVSRWPISSIVGIQYCPSASLPPTWTVLDPSQYYVSTPQFAYSGISSSGAAGAYAVMIGGNAVTWANGRSGTRVQIQYTNGWAHAGITASTPAGSTMITVDDRTGTQIFNYDGANTGATMWIFDGVNTELVKVAQDMNDPFPTGPGTLVLENGTQFEHNGTALQPILISSMPETVQNAAILHATYQALVRGGTAITTQNMPGSVVGQGGAHSTTILDDAKALVNAYRRVI